MVVFKRVWKRVRGARVGQFQVNPELVKEEVDDMALSASVEYVKVHDDVQPIYASRISVAQHIYASRMSSVVEQAISAGFNLVEALCVMDTRKRQYNKVQVPPMVEDVVLEKKKHKKHRKEKEEDEEKKREKKEEKREKREKHKKKHVPRYTVDLEEGDEDMKFAKQMSLELYHSLPSLESMHVPTVPTVAAAVAVDSNTLSIALSEFGNVLQVHHVGELKHEDMGKKEEKEEEGPCCSICLTLASELSGSGGGLAPIISDVDANSPARCTHLICRSCNLRMVREFLRSDATTLECVECRRHNVPLRRCYVDVGACYFVDPSTFARFVKFDPHFNEEMRGKNAYLRAFLTISFDSFTENARRHNHTECPRCEFLGDGPLTIACQNLARCTNISCMFVYCVHCRDTVKHAEADCPARRRELEMAAAKEGFDPSVGRTCPYGCGRTGLQHYRGDGCHILSCPGCKRSFCFVCGATKKGDKHHALDGRTCQCSCFCIPTCPCVKDPNVVVRRSMFDSARRDVIVVPEPIRSVDGDSDDDYDFDDYDDEFGADVWVRINNILASRPNPPPQP